MLFLISAAVVQILILYTAGGSVSGITVSLLVGCSQVQGCDCLVELLMANW